MYIQYPDLTELASYELYKECNPLKIKTEFAFFTAMSKHSGNANIATNITLLETMGFKRLTSMCNWWPSHWYDKRVMDFWWKRYEENTEPQPSRRYVWGGREYPWLNGLIAATGCGFKIGHFPLKRNLYYRFFSLLRLTKKPSALDKKWLERYNFKKIDEGRIAEYWLNGWPYEDYSLEMEMKYWKKHDPEEKLRAKVEDFNA